LYNIQKMNFNEREIEKCRFIRLYYNNYGGREIKNLKEIESFITWIRNKEFIFHFESYI